jgi:hypothetical protein
MHELICFCLEIPANRWPPDHYTLLGLDPGDADIRRIEQRVQERVEKLRRYQLTHADQVTDGMNRLAQALVCLTDPAAKEAYDAKLLARSMKPKLRPQVSRSNHSPSFDFSRQAERERAPAHRLHGRRFPRWLLLAWSLWLLVGLAGLFAVIWKLPDLKASYSRTQNGAKAVTKWQKAGAAAASPTTRRTP